MARYSGAWRETEDAGWVVQRNEHMNGQTVGALFDWCTENELDPGAITIIGNFTLRWESPATDEEIAKRDDWARQADERREAWEVETLARLKAKYEAAR